MDEFLASLGFVRIAEVVGQALVYRPEAAALAGKGGAVYVFVNPDGRVWKVGMTRKGFSRVNYTRVFDGRAMKRPDEQSKLESIWQEVKPGAAQWVLRTDEPKLVETLLTCLLEPTESRRQRSKAENALRRHPDPVQASTTEVPTDTGRPCPGEKCSSTALTWDDPEDFPPGESAPR